MLLVSTSFIINTRFSLSPYLLFFTWLKSILPFLTTCRDFSLKSSKAIRYFSTVYKVFEHQSQFPLILLFSNKYSWVNHVLELHQGDTIDELRVLFEMDGTFTSEIDNWLLFSLEKRELKSSHCISSPFGIVTLTPILLLVSFFIVTVLIL